RESRRSRFRIARTPFHSFKRLIHSQAELRDLAADYARALLENSRPLKQRAQGKPGARCTRGLVCKNAQKKRTRAYRFSGGIRPSLRNGFNGFLRALLGDRALLSPSSAELPPPT